MILIDGELCLQEHDEQQGAERGAPMDAGGRAAGRPAGHRADERQRVSRAGGSQGGRRQWRRRRPCRPGRLHGRAVDVVTGVVGSDANTSCSQIKYTNTSCS